MPDGKNADSIYNYIVRNVSIAEVKECLEKNKPLGIEAMEIEKQLGIVRNNASAILNQLCQKGKLEKLQGRPVRFVPKEVAEAINTMSLEKINQESRDPFYDLVGYNTYLRTQIELAKSALLYPPNGLHTLLIGASGSGKTYFASKMHLYLERRFNKSISYVAFNCSDYYHNPELLLSQLFGHIKGAFTGADSDKEGLVAKADGGILFLDEVHRLPHEGQEMLFRLIDTHRYSRLGEANKISESNVLLIAATTEEPDKYLLKTFLRRIPVTISLPSLESTSIQDRLNLIERLFNREAEIINKRIIVTEEVVKMLTLYKCAGNIGQMESDIKLICANTFMKEGAADILRIEPNSIPPHIKKAFTNITDIKKEYLWFISSVGDIVAGKAQKGLNESCTAEDVESYYKKILQDFSQKHFNLKELYNLMDSWVVDITLKTVNLASTKLNYQFKEEMVFAMSFHVKKMLDRVDSGAKIVSSQSEAIMREHPLEYHTAEAMVQLIAEEFKICVPPEETVFIAMILVNSMIQEELKSDIGIVIVQHGASTASSMAQVCNRLLKTDSVEAFDIALDEGALESYDKIKSMVKRLNTGKGVILLADLDSITDIGDRITEETGCIVRTVLNVSTPAALEIVRRALYSTHSIDEICEIKPICGRGDTRVKMPNAILAVCATGEGTGKIAETVLLQLLSLNNYQDVAIFPISIEGIMSKSENYMHIQSHYNIIASVGGINPWNGLPFLDIQKLLTEEGKQEILRIIQKESKSAIPADQNVSDIYLQAEEILSEHILYVNLKRAMKAIRRFLVALEEDGIFLNDEMRLKLIMHICCMMERNVMKSVIHFDNAEAYMREQENLYQIVKKSLRILEGEFRISISDDEICFILKVITYRQAE